MDCEHRLDWIKRRPNGNFYCAVCRKVLYEQTELFGVLNAEQRRTNRLLRERRTSRIVGMDKYEQDSNR